MGGLNQLKTHKSYLAHKLHDVRLRPKARSQDPDEALKAGHIAASQLHHKEEIGIFQIVEGLVLRNSMFLVGCRIRFLHIYFQQIHTPEGNH
jgi:hypothetical protein